MSYTVTTKQTRSVTHVFKAVDRDVTLEAALRLLTTEAGISQVPACEGGTRVSICRSYIISSLVEYNNKIDIKMRYVFPTYLAITRQRFSC